MGLALVGALAFTFVGSPASRAVALARDVNDHALVFRRTLTPSTPFTGDTLRVDAVAFEPDLASFAGIHYHRLHGEIDWCTPGERYDGTPFTDRGFDNIPALQHLVPWLAELRTAA